MKMFEQIVNGVLAILIAALAMFVGVSIGVNWVIKDIETSYNEYMESANVITAKVMDNNYKVLTQRLQCEKFGDYFMDHIGNGD